MANNLFDDPELNAIAEQSHLSVLGRQVHLSDRLQLLLNNLLDPRLQRGLGVTFPEDYLSYFCSFNFRGFRLAVSFGPNNGTYVISAVFEACPRQNSMVSMPLRAEEVQLALLAVLRRIAAEPHSALERVFHKEPGFDA